MRKCVQIFCSLLLSGVLCFSADPPSSKKVTADQKIRAQRLFQDAERAARFGDSFRAYLLYAEAARIDPANSLYDDRRLAFQNSPGLRGRQMTEDPANETTAARVMAEGLTRGEMLEADKAEPPVQLAGKPGIQSFDLRGDSREIIEKIAASYGIQTVFDPSYQAVPNIRFQVKDLDYRSALRILETSTDSFLVPMNRDLALVARETTQNRTQFAPVMSVAVPIPERISVQEAQELSTAVQQTVEIRRISMDPVKRVVYFRDSVPKALAARQMFLDLSRARAQVEVEVELISVNKTSSLSYGLALPTAYPIVDFGKSLLGFNVIPSTIAGNFFAFGGGATLMGLGIGTATALATLSKASGDTLVQAQVVALDGQAVTLNVGDRYPVITGSFSGLTPTTVVSPTLSPTINYQDLGLQLKLTPVVHEGGEVTLEVDAQFKTLGAVAANGIPSIGSRQYQGKVRMKDGEWAVLAGLISLVETNTIDGIAGVTSLPVIGKALSRTTKSSDKTETLILLKPRVTNQPPWETPTAPIWIGTETRPLDAF
jgi:general secretion pathway protein D